MRNCLRDVKSHGGRDQESELLEFGCLVLLGGGKMAATFAQRAQMAARRTAPTRTSANNAFCLCFRVDYAFRQRFSLVNARSIIVTCRRIHQHSKDSTGAQSGLTCLLKLSLAQHTLWERQFPATCISFACTLRMLSRIEGVRPRQKCPEACNSTELACAAERGLAACE